METPPQLCLAPSSPPILLWSQCFALAAIHRVPTSKGKMVDIFRHRSLVRWPLGVLQQNQKQETTAKHMKAEVHRHHTPTPAQREPTYTPTSLREAAGEIRCGRGCGCQVGGGRWWNKTQFFTSMSLLVHVSSFLFSSRRLQLFTCRRLRSLVSPSLRNSFVDTFHFLPLHLTKAQMYKHQQQEL